MDTRMNHRVATTTIRPSEGYYPMVFLVDGVAVALVWGTC